MDLIQRELGGQVIGEIRGVARLRWGRVPARRIG